MTTISAEAMWARSEIRRNPWSLIVVALLMAVAGGAVTAGVAGARRAGDAVDRFADDSNASDVVIYTEMPLSADLRATMEADPRIATISEVASCWRHPLAWSRASVG